MSNKVNDVKKKLEEIFNVPARIVENAVKINVKEIKHQQFMYLFTLLACDLTIKRSGPGLIVIAKFNQ